MEEGEKGHSRHLLLSISCLLDMEDKACQPGPETLMGDRQQPELTLLTVLAPALSCQA